MFDKKKAIDVFMKMIESNNVFASQYSRGSIKSRLDINIEELKRVSTIHEDKRASGAWYLTENQIKITKDTTENEDQAILHQMIHALTTIVDANRNINYCGIMKIITVKENGKPYYYSSGRALNEGFTECIAERIYKSIGKYGNVPARTYINEERTIGFRCMGTRYLIETNIAKQLEAIFGEPFILSYLCEHRLEKTTFLESLISTRDPEYVRKKIYLMSKFYEIRDVLDRAQAGSISYEEALLHASDIILNVFFVEKIIYTQAIGNKMVAAELLEVTKKLAKYFPRFYKMRRDMYRYDLKNRISQSQKVYHGIMSVGSTEDLGVTDKMIANLRNEGMDQGEASKKSKVTQKIRNLKQKFLPELTKEERKEEKKRKRREIIKRVIQKIRRQERIEIRKTEEVKEELEEEITRVREEEERIRREQEELITNGLDISQNEEGKGNDKL